MVRFDRRRRAVDRDRFDHVGIDRSLGEPLHVGQFLRLGVEYFDEIAADNLPFLFRVGHAGQVGEEFIAGPYADYVQSHRLVGFQHRFEFVFAKQAHIDEDADQLIAYRFVQQFGRHRRIDAAGESQQYLVAFDLVAQFADGRFDERVGRPLLAAAADIHDEMFQQLFAFGRMVHFRVKLDAPGLFAFDLEGGDRNGVRAGDDAVVFRNLHDRISMRHPYLRLVRKACDQRVVRNDFR